MMVRGVVQQPRISRNCQTLPDLAGLMHKWPIGPCAGANYERQRVKRPGRLKRVLPQGKKFSKRRKSLFVPTGRRYYYHVERIYVLEHNEAIQNVVNMTIDSGVRDELLDRA